MNNTPIDQLSKEDQKNLKDLEEQFIKNSWRLVIYVVFPLLMGILPDIMIPTIYSVFSSQFARSGIENVSRKYFSDTMITEAITDELMIVAFEYN